MSSSKRHPSSKKAKDNSSEESSDDAALKLLREQIKALEKKKKEKNHKQQEKPKKTVLELSSDSSQQEDAMSISSSSSSSEKNKKGKSKVEKQAEPSKKQQQQPSKVDADSMSISSSSEDKAKKEPSSATKQSAPKKSAANSKAKAEPATSEAKKNKRRTKSLSAKESAEGANARYYLEHANPFVAAFKHSVDSYASPIKYLEQFWEADATLKVMLPLKTGHVNIDRLTPGVKEIYSVVTQHFTKKGGGGDNNNNKEPIPAGDFANVEAVLEKYMVPVWFIAPELLLAKKPNGAIDEKFLVYKTDKLMVRTASINVEEASKYLVELATNPDLRKAWAKTTILTEEMRSAYWKVVDDLIKKVAEEGVTFVDRLSAEARARNAGLDQKREEVDTLAKKVQKYHGMLKEAENEEKKAKIKKHYLKWKDSFKQLNETYAKEAAEAYATQELPAIDKFGFYVGELTYCRNESTDDLSVDSLMIVPKRGYERILSEMSSINAAEAKLAKLTGNTFVRKSEKREQNKSEVQKQLGAYPKITREIATKHYASLGALKRDYLYAASVDWKDGASFEFTTSYGKNVKYPLYPLRHIIEMTDVAEKLVKRLEEKLSKGGGGGGDDGDNEDGSDDADSNNDGGNADNREPPPPKPPKKGDDSLSSSSDDEDLNNRSPQEGVSKKRTAAEASLDSLSLSRSDEEEKADATLNKQRAEKKPAAKKAKVVDHTQESGVRAVSTASASQKKDKSKVIDLSNLPADEPVGKKKKKEEAAKDSKSRVVVEEDRNDPMDVDEPAVSKEDDEAESAKDAHQLLQEMLIPESSIHAYISQNEHSEVDTAINKLKAKGNVHQFYDTTVNNSTLPDLPTLYQSIAALKNGSHALQQQKLGAATDHATQSMINDKMSLEVIPQTFLFGLNLGHYLTGIISAERDFNGATEENYIPQFVDYLNDDAKLSSLALHIEQTYASHQALDLLFNDKNGLLLSSA